MCDNFCSMTNGTLLSSEHLRDRLREHLREILKITYGRTVVRQCTYLNIKKTSQCVLS